MLNLYLGKNQAEVKIFKFPAGESGASFTSPLTGSYVEPLAGCITLKWEGNEDLINLALLVDAVRRQHPQV